MVILFQHRNMGVLFTWHKIRFHRAICVSSDRYDKKLTENRTALLCEVWRELELKNFSSLRLDFCAEIWYDFNVILFFWLFNFKIAQ